MLTKIKKNLTKETDTREFVSMVNNILDDIFDGSVDYDLNKPLQIVIFNCFITKVIKDEREQKYRLLLLRAMATLLESAIQNINIFKPEHVLTKNKSIN